MNDKSVIEDKMTNEITSLKRQVKFYKEKLKLELITSTKKTDLNSTGNKKFPRNVTEKSKNNGNNITIELKGKLLNEIHTSDKKSWDWHNDNKPLNITKNDKIWTKPDENVNANGNMSFEKIANFQSNEKAYHHNGNIRLDKKNNMTTRDKIKCNAFPQNSKKSQSKSSNKHLFATELANNRQLHLNNSHNDKNKVNLN